MGAFLTSLDHLSQVGLSKNLGHPEHHQGILGADQVCAESSVQKADKELCVEQQVLLDKRLPLRKQPAESMISGFPVQLRGTQENQLQQIRVTQVWPFLALQRRPGT